MPQGAPVAQWQQRAGHAKRAQVRVLARANSVLFLKRARTEAGKVYN